MSETPQHIPLYQENPREEMAECLKMLKMYPETSALWQKAFHLQQSLPPSPEAEELGLQLAVLQQQRCGRVEGLLNALEANLSDAQIYVNALSGVMSVEKDFGPQPHLSGRFAGLKIRAMQSWGTTQQSRPAAQEVQAA